MEIRGRVHNGVVLIKSQLSLPEGTLVTVVCDTPAVAQTAAEKRIEFPLVRSKHPGTLQLTAERVAEFLEEEDVSA
jgi:hypothetical protein